MVSFFPVQQNEKQNKKAFSVAEISIAANQLSTLTSTVPVINKFCLNA